MGDGGDLPYVLVVGVCQFEGEHAVGGDVFDEHVVGWLCVFVVPPYVCDDFVYLFAVQFGVHWRFIFLLVAV